MKIIGLTGGVGSGKSTIAKIMQDKYHAHILIADDIGHLAMEQGQDSYNRIVELFGTSILDVNGAIDRRLLSEMVFNNSEKLKLLNSVIHPFVYEYIMNTIHKLKDSTETKILIIESAILVEAGYTKMCDEIWYVSTSEEIRVKRLQENRGYTTEKISMVMKNQSTDKIFCENCTKIIYNNDEINDIYEQIENLLV